MLRKWDVCYPSILPPFWKETYTLPADLTFSWITPTSISLLHFVSRAFLQYISAKSIQLPTFSSIFPFNAAAPRQKSFPWVQKLHLAPGASNMPGAGGGISGHWGVLGRGQQAWPRSWWEPNNANGEASEYGHQWQSRSRHAQTVSATLFAAWD